MGEFLLFRLAAAMAATGDVAAQPRRDSERWPARSAVLGIVAAALGLRRDETDAQRRLQSDYDVAVRVREVGTSLRDYHTVQTVPSAAVKRPDSRPMALLRGARKGALNTILTQREYREGMYVEVALSAREDARWAIESLADALARPRFVLYFGRKACPLTSPLFPRCLEAKDIMQAFSSYAALDAHEASPEKPDGDGFVVTDRALLVDPEADGISVIRRWDVAMERERWHFAERDAYLVRPEAETRP